MKKNYRNLSLEEAFSQEKINNRNCKPRLIEGICKSFKILAKMIKSNEKIRDCAFKMMQADLGMISAESPTSDPQVC